MYIIIKSVQAQASLHLHPTFQQVNQVSPQSSLYWFVESFHLNCVFFVRWEHATCVNIQFFRNLYKCLCYASTQLVSPASLLLSGS
jgi:hypothetical protein